MAKKIPCFKDIRLTPLDGAMDLRSPSGTVAPRDFRLSLNMTLTEQRKLCRMGGWTKLFSDSPFGFLNQDLHDQLTNCQYYYLTYAGTFSDPGGLTGYQYSYFQPEVIVAPYIQHTTGDTSCGYAEDSGYDLNQMVLNQWFVCDSFTGYPYTLVSDPSAACNTGAPDFYVGSYFTLCRNDEFPGSDTPGYGFGSFLGTYTEPSSYDFTYCGDYLFDRYGCREAISMLSEIVTENGSRKLIAATKHRINSLNERSGNYRILVDGVSGGTRNQEDCIDCPTRRFKSTTIGAVMVLTNDFDPVLYHAFDDTAEGCNLWSAKYIQDLIELGITKAAVIASWNGFVLIADVEQEGNHHPTRIFWSDFNNPTSWSPSTESAAGYTDLGIGERILAMQALGGSLMVYTNKAIYKGAFVGGDLVFKFPEIYRGEDSIRFPNSLVSLGDAHIYCGENGIFVIGQYDNSPRRIEWIHKASEAIFKGVSSNFVKSFDGLSAFGPVNKAVCENLVGGYNGVEKDVWFSWPTDLNTCQNMSLKLNLTYASATLVDHGFSAFATYRPDLRATVGDFMREWQICLYSEFGSNLAKEGEPYSTGVESFPNPPSYIWNDTEDPDLPMHPDSLSARFGTLSLDDLCPTCETGTVFVMADAQDRTLKQFRQDLQYRERYTGSTDSLPCPQTVPGQYVLDGYYSMLQSDAQNFGIDEDKLIDKIRIDFTADIQALPNNIYCHVAYGIQPDCLIWDNPAAKELMCLTDKTDAEHEANNTRPAEGAMFPQYRRGRYVAWRFYINGTGGGACFSQLTQHVRPIQGDWKQ